MGVCEKNAMLFSGKRLEALEQARSLLPSVVAAFETAWWVYTGRHNILSKSLGW